MPTTFLNNAILTSTPITDSTAIWAPPKIGPLNGSHMWMAHTMRGATTGTRRLPDMLGTLDIWNAADGTREFVDGKVPVIVVNQGQDRLTERGSNTEAAALTVLFVANLKPTKIQQIKTPGWGIGGNAAGMFAVTGTAEVPSSTPVPTGMAVYAVTFSAGTINAWINGQQVMFAKAGTAQTTDYWSIGASNWTSTDREEFVLLKAWPRVLTASEIAEATADAKRLAGIA